MQTWPSLFCNHELSYKINSKMDGDKWQYQQYHITYNRTCMVWCETVLFKEWTHWGREIMAIISQTTFSNAFSWMKIYEFRRRQSIVWSNAGTLLLGPLVTNLSENLIKILTFSFMKMQLKVLSAKWHPFCLGLNVLKYLLITIHADMCDECNLCRSGRFFVCHIIWLIKIYSAKL